MKKWVLVPKSVLTEIDRYLVQCFKKLWQNYIQALHISAANSYAE